MPEIKDKKYGKTAFYIDVTKLKIKTTTSFYIDGVKFRKSRNGQKFYFDNFEIKRSRNEKYSTMLKE
jgi:hypothetical protein